MITASTLLVELVPSFEAPTAPAKFTYMRTSSVSAMKPVGNTIVPLVPADLATTDALPVLSCVALYTTYHPTSVLSCELSDNAVGQVNTME